MKIRESLATIKKRIGRVRTKQQRIAFLFKGLLLTLIVLSMVSGTIFSLVVYVQAKANKELFVNQAAETLRSVIGLHRANRIEWLVFKTKRKFHKLFHHSHGRVNASLAARLTLPLPNSPVQEKKSDRPTDLAPLIVSPVMRGEGRWQALPARSPGLWMTQIRPDAEEPDNCVNLVAIDFGKLNLKFIPGTEVTSNTSLSSIPERDRSSLVAIFNGGFRNHHSDTGQRKTGIQYKPLQNGKGSVILTDNDVQICKWDETLNAKYPTADVMQNLVLLLEEGIHHEGFLNHRHLDFSTYRTGLGMTADHRWLIFAAGNDLCPQDLATALRLASCSNAIHLDQNRGNVFFDVVRPKSQALEFVGIDPSLHLILNDKVLSGSNRCFFYLAQRPAEALQKQQAEPSKPARQKSHELAYGR